MRLAEVYYTLSPNQGKLQHRSRLFHMLLSDTTVTMFRPSRARRREREEKDLAESETRRQDMAPKKPTGDSPMPP
ncbi:hypothetical protein C0J45_11516 [Silurus meridionalis]|nr:hypothetical protein C0J45_11516 [Silurus meridionalis]